MRDREIVAAVVAGDPVGLAAAFDAYAPALHAYCRSLLAEPADAADAVQDTFVIAAAKLGGLRDPDRLRPWLYAVARNECHRRLRGRARLAVLDEAADDMTDTAAGPAEEADRAAVAELVTAAVAGLNPGDREVIDLTLRHDIDGSDLAGALGVPVNQAHALASRARGQLERSLGALLVARAGRRACPELDAILEGWDGRLTILLRKRVSRHIDRCEACGECRRRELSPAMLLSTLPLPLAALSPGLREQVLRLGSGDSPAAAPQRDLIVRQAGKFRESGFPVPVSPPGTGRSGPRLRAAALTSAAAVILLAVGGTTSFYLLRHDHDAASRRHVAAATVTSPALTEPAASASPASARPSPSASSPAASPTVTPAATSAPRPSPSPSPTGSPTQSAGTIEVLTPQPVELQQTFTPAYEGSFTITAQGGPASYTISEPAGELTDYMITTEPASGTVPAGQSQTIQVSVTTVPGIASSGNPYVTLASGQKTQTVQFTLSPPIQ
jgi:RNA polymerase sigma factor (sigma-70 family)